jgi:hypothetical protein
LRPIPVLFNSFFKLYLTKKVLFTMMTPSHMTFKTMRVAGVTVSVQPRPRTPYTVLRVAAIVDTGDGRQTAILKNALPWEWEIDIDKPASKKGLSLPRRIANLDCVYTGRKFGVVVDVADALKAVAGNARIAAIVPDVLAPGDFMVFRHDGPKLRTRFAGALRAIPCARARAVNETAEDIQ